MYVTEGLKPEKVFKYFEEISRFPRGSGNEQAVAEYCVKFAEERGLDAYADEYNNVLIKKPGSNGKESENAVLLQGHLDMVCEKNAGIEHDFLKDPIRLIVEGDDLKADGTTLGADNGIAIAIILAILDDDKAIHPPLECLLTSEEELGLTGAINFDYSQINSRSLINIDSEEYGKIVVSCAGGLRTDTELPINWTASSLTSAKTFALRVRGLKGGHSGCDIHLERANAIKLIGRTLDFLYGKIDFELCGISGGAKDNAIPREAQAYLNINSDDSEKLEALISDFEKTIIDEFRNRESEISIKCDAEESRQRVYAKDTMQKAIGIIMTTPNGVHAMSFDIEGLVETSNNLGVITEEENAIIFSCAVRSSVESRKQQLEAMIKNVAMLADAKFTSKASYPGWQYDPDSKLRVLASRVFKELTGTELKAEALHAGLECGIIKEKLPGADALSMGPDMWDVHTPDERLSISSVEKLYTFMLGLLEEI